MVNGGRGAIWGLFIGKVFLEVHQTFQVPKMEVRTTYISCMDTAYVRETHTQKKESVNMGSCTFQVS